MPPRLSPKQKVAVADNPDSVPQHPAPVETSESVAPRQEIHEEVSPPPPTEGEGVELQSSPSGEVGTQKMKSAAGAGGDSVSAGPASARFGTIDGPRVEKMVKPKYPFGARRLRKEGKVLLRLHIDRSGTVRSAEVVE